MTPTSHSGPTRAAADCRCDCGSLLARVVIGGIELKCRSCKRLLLVPVKPGVEPGHPLELIPVTGTGKKL